MKLSFLGAAREVTGSCFLIEINDKRILVDCGMQQGPDIYENQAIPENAENIDCVLLTHAHIDHSGNLPLLYKKGFRGDIHLTRVSADLADIMLRDSAHIQEQEQKWRNKKERRGGKTLYEPIYTLDDAVGAIGLFVPHEYDKEYEICPGVKICFRDAGHLLGSASIEVHLTENDVTKKIVFSGDIGNVNQPLLNDPTYIKDADYVIMESTYGDRLHDTKEDYVGQLTTIIVDTLTRGGNLVIPSFAIGRTQEILYIIRQIKESGALDRFGDFPVFVDSPLAIEATSIFSRNIDCCDQGTLELIKQGINPLMFKGLKMAITTQDSIAINADKTPKIIISASGMCEAGRIRHHLKHNLYKRENTILFVGYQAVNTLGRKIQDGASYVSLFGESIKVEARIRSLQGISGHADKQGLLNWASHFDNAVEKVFVVHGEDKVAENFANALESALDLKAVAPYPGETWDLASGQQTARGNHLKIIREKAREPYMTPAYQNLLASMSYLEAIVRENRGGTNFDLNNFAKDLEKLAEKYKRKF